MKKFSDYKFQILALGILIGAILSTRGGLAALVPLFKIIMPILLIVLVLNLVKKKVMAAFGGNLKKHFERAMEQQGMASPRGKQGSDSQTLQLCSKCGSYATPNHVCKS